MQHQRLIFHSWTLSVLFRIRYRPSAVRWFALWKRRTMLVRLLQFDALNHRLLRQSRIISHWVDCKSRQQLQLLNIHDKHRRCFYFTHWRQRTTQNPYVSRKNHTLFQLRSSFFKWRLTVNFKRASHQHTRNSHLLLSVFTHWNHLNLIQKRLQQFTGLPRLGKRYFKCWKQSGQIGMAKKLNASNLTKSVFQCLFLIGLRG